MLGIIPAAGAGQRIQPLGCSKELLPVGSRQIKGVDRPKAVAEYLVERMIAAGAKQICMVISGDKGDIVRYFAEREYAAEIFYTVQPTPAGLCDAVFRACSFVAPHEHVLVGLPDTIWFPENALLAARSKYPDAAVNLLLFPVAEPSNFDSVIHNECGEVSEVQVKREDASSIWVWGAMIFTARAFTELHHLWEARHRADEYLGDLLNAYIAAGNVVHASPAGETYIDVGTIAGYHRAQDFLRGVQHKSAASGLRLVG